ncbi:MAG: hypothetical protein JOS17DRAFT_165148 [Linnemannia elongata]|nr:MAG: hypothetical protein JOS17DRAFT_165148 [Linnemannia elongata]
MDHAPCSMLLFLLSFSSIFLSPPFCLWFFFACMEPSVASDVAWLCLFGISSRKLSFFYFAHIPTFLEISFFLLLASSIPLQCFGNNKNNNNTTIVGYNDKTIWTALCDRKKSNLPQIDYHSPSLLQISIVECSL